MTLVQPYASVRLRFAALLGSALWLVATAVAGASPLDALALDSPFVPGVGVAKATASAGMGGALEFRGVLVAGGETLVGIFNRETGESFWIPVRSNSGDDEPLTASDYDPAASRVRVSYQGRAYSLVLADAVIGVAPDGSASADLLDMTEALASTLAAADAELEFPGDEFNGRRLVLARFGTAPTVVPHDEGNPIAFTARDRRNPSLANRPRVAALDPAMTTDTAFTLATADTSPSLADAETALALEDDGGRRLLIRRRVGQTQTGALRQD